MHLLLGMFAVLCDRTHSMDLQVLKDTEALFINGFVLDEIPASEVVAAAQQAQRAGAAVFFDPGAHENAVAQ